MKVLPTMDTSNTTGTKPTSAAAVSPDLTNHGFLPVNPKKTATPAKPPAKPTAQSGASSKNRFDALARSNEEETYMDAVLHGRTPPEKDDAEEQGHEGETTSTSGSKRSRSSCAHFDGALFPHLSCSNSYSSAEE